MPLGHQWEKAFSVTDKNTPNVSDISGHLLTIICHHLCMQIILTRKDRCSRKTLNDHSHEPDADIQQQDALVDDDLKAAH